jgi:RNA polymerase sigma-70 factor (ECF subfamily)
VSDDEERVWVEQARAGDSAGVGYLYERYVDRIYRYILLKIGNPQDAEDLTGQVFVRMLEGIGNFQWQGASFQAWLYRIAHNLTVDYLRQRTRRPQVPLEPLVGVLLADGDDPYSWAEAADFRDHLRAALARLTELQAQVIALKFGGGLSNAEVGQLLGRSEGAVKALQHSALTNLNKWLHNLMGDEERPRRRGRTDA